ncbi:MAG: hypothetical protein KA252_03505, partial [Sphingorhabdus sp.]|nr:hypothetical protein [Sphingorhabdus sp.]
DYGTQSKSMDLKDRRKIQPARRSYPAPLANTDNSIALHFMKLINCDPRSCAKIPTLIREFAPFAAVRQKQGSC